VNNMLENSGGRDTLQVQGIVGYLPLGYICIRIVPSGKS